MKFEILTYPDPRLRKISEEVKEIDGNLKKFIDALVKTMYEKKGCVGIAAPQVNFHKRIIVVDSTRFRRPPPNPIGLQILINPVIIHKEGEIVFKEGCLSIPELLATVKRANRIFLKAWTMEEKEIEMELAGIEAVLIQHEIDHLDGILFLDRISSVTDLIPRKVK